MMGVTEVLLPYPRSTRSINHDNRPKIYDPEAIGKSSMNLSTGDFLYPSIQIIVFIAKQTFIVSPPRYPTYRGFLISQPNKNPSARREECGIWDQYRLMIPRNLIGNAKTAIAHRMNFT